MNSTAQMFWRAHRALAAIALLLAWMDGSCSDTTAAPPLRWRWSNPKPHGGNIVDLAYSPTLNLAVEVTELGQVFSSVDLNLWTPRETGTTNDLRAVAFLGNRILVTGSSGTVLYADDVTTFQAGVLTSGVTTDWLEAVTTSPQLAVAVAVGDNGAVYTSTNGVYWRRQSSGTAQWLRGVAWGAGVFVAVGENGKIISSSSGTNWTARSSGTSQHLNRVSYAGGRFTVVAENGDCRFSTNSGVNWHAELTGATNDLFGAVTFNDIDLVLGDHEVRSHGLDGVWVDELGVPGTILTPWTYYAAARPPDFVLLAGRTGLMEEGHTNTTSLEWVHGDESLRNWIWGVTHVPGLYVAAGDRATILTSGNGADWKLEFVPDAVTNAVLLGIGGTPNLLAAAGSGGSLMISPNIVSNYTVTNIVGTNIIITNISASAFGVVWYAIRSSVTNDLEAVGASSDRFVVTGAKGTILTSLDGTNWSQRPSPTSKYLSGVTAWPGGWIACGDDASMVSSPDGLTWTLVPMPNTNWFYRVRYLGGRLVVVGQSGSILTSSNGTAWTPQISGTTKWLNDVTYLNDTWFVVGNSGTVLMSSNTVNWTSIGTLTRKSLYGAATDGRQLIAVGIEGAILRAQIITDTTPIHILSYDRDSTTVPGGTVARNLFLFGGQVDQRFTLDYRAELETNVWVTGPQLEFFDGSGTLFYLETLTSSNLPPREYYRATLIEK
ncbi:MAG TPA: hypothetical protein VNH84_13430 [Candidatus Saccharimonadales bacterium]|nr:hypothetical protein [Candidatus Saccharimonadales bacterium]